MSGGTIERCNACGRLIIHGQKCTCGKKSNDPTTQGSPE